MGACAASKAVQLFGARLVGECLRDEPLGQSRLVDEFLEHVGVADIPTRLPERVEDGTVELFEGLGMGLACPG
jgi:hypothetical protein